MAVGGAIGGLITFLIINPIVSKREGALRQAAEDAMRRLDFEQLKKLMADRSGHMSEALVLGLVVGVAIGVALVIAEEVQTPRLGRMAMMALSAALVGAVCGAIGTFVAEAVFSSLASVAFGMLLIVARTLGWAVMGIAAGICPGAVARSGKRVLYGIAGGAIGGGIGGIMFDTLGAITNTGTVSRAVGFPIMGAAIGAAVGLVEEIAKQYWLTVLSGAKEGRSYILSKNETILGRDELADIPLFGDYSVQKQHAKLVKGDGVVHVLAAQGSAVAVNSRMVSSAPLSDGALIGIGKHYLRFHARRAGNVAYQPAQQGAPPQYAPRGYMPTQSYAPSQAPGPVTRLMVAQGPHAGERFFLTPGMLVVGREPGCDIHLLRDTLASRRHARLVTDGIGWRIEDLGSTNGVYVNNQRVSSQALKPGDVIAIGQSLLRAE